MKANRLISILMILQANRHITAAELAARFEVSIRTIFRDVEALSDMGIPLYTDRGQNGGIKLMDDYNVSLSGLSIRELYYLFIPTSNRLLTDLGIEKPDDSTLLNLIQTLPADEARVLEDIQNRLYIDSQSWRGRENEENNTDTLMLLQRAVWECNTLILDYKDKNKTIKPLSLVLKGFTWYCVALDDSTIKTYRVSMMNNLQSTEETFERPADFDLEKYWDQSMRQFRKKLPSYIVNLKTDNKTYENMKLRRLKIQDVVVEDDVYLVTLRFDAFFQAVDVMMGYGSAVVVETPQELIDEMLKKARGIFNTY